MVVVIGMVVVVTTGIVVAVSADNPAVSCIASVTEIAGLININALGHAPNAVVVIPFLEPAA